MIPFRIVLGRPVHHAFVTDSWVSCDRDAPDGWRSRGLSISAAKGIVRGILGASTVELRIACVPDDDEAILGWACLEPSVVHYIYLRAKFGVAGTDGAAMLRRLLERMRGPGEYTHQPGGKMRIPRGWTYAA